MGIFQSFGKRKVFMGWRRLPFRIDASKTNIVVRRTKYFVGLLLLALSLNESLYITNT